MAQDHASPPRRLATKTPKEEMLIERLDALEHFCSLKDAKGEMSEITSLFGLKNISYGAVNLPQDTNNDRAIVVTTYSKAWHDFYFEHCYIDIDPVVKVGISGAAPVDWRSISRKASAVREFFERAKEFGVGSQGLTVPIRGRLGEIALFSVTSDETDERWDEFLKHNKSLLLLFAWTFHNSMLRVLGASTQSAISLSHREATCLRLKALGKTDSEIAEIIGITKRTVSFHMESARSRLNAVNAVHAVAKALSLGLITLAHEPMVKTL